jgi:hypothetical protein
MAVATKMAELAFAAVPWARTISTTPEAMTKGTMPA